jgi:hypothetical protein
LLAQLHPLLKVSAHRDARDAFVPRSSSAAAKIPGVDIDEQAVDLEMSIAHVRARARVSFSFCCPPHLTPYSIIAQFN